LRAAAIALGLTLALAAGGCGVDPVGGETLPPISSTQVRITDGPGTSSQYASEVAVQPGNVVQLRILIADGNAVEVRVPRGPTQASEAIAVADDGESAEITLRSATGEPFTLDRPFQFDPGYIGVEQRSDGEELAVRISTPRLTGTGQGQVPFTFKVRVVA
jgi:hypothetical protein